MNDKTNLDAIFTEVLSQPRDADRGNYYQALVDYADGLAWLQDDQRAWGYFEDAMRFHPEQKIEAVNRYAFHLLNKKKAREAVNVLETQFTAQERSVLVLPAYFRKEALAALEEDTKEAEQEVLWLRRRVSENGGSSAVRFIDSQPLRANSNALGFKELAGMLLAPVSEVQAFSHTSPAGQPSDDCRTIDWQTAFNNGNLCDITGNCYDPFSVNVAEIIDNEAKIEIPGARYAVGWVVKNRAFQSLTAAVPDAFGNYSGPACDSYPGAQGGALTTNCVNTVPCGHDVFCTESKKVCCAAHGGTTTSGANHLQFNDGHVSFSTLLFRGTMAAAVYVLDGSALDIATTFAPAGVSGCDFTTCGEINSNLQPSQIGPFCSIGANFHDPNPDGAMQYLNTPNNAAARDCKWRQKATCPNGVASGGTGDNYFWARRVREGPSSVVGIEAATNSVWSMMLFSLGTTRNFNFAWGDTTTFPPPATTTTTGWKKVVPIKWPNGDGATMPAQGKKSKLVAIDNIGQIRVRDYDSDATAASVQWSTWANIGTPPGTTAIDVSAVAKWDGGHEIWAVGQNGSLYWKHCTGFSSSTTCTAAWQQAGFCCVSKVALAVIPPGGGTPTSGTLYITAQASTANLSSAVWVTKCVNNNCTVSTDFTLWTNLGQMPGGLVRELSMLSYIDTVAIFGASAGGCNLYQRHKLVGQDMWDANWNQTGVGSCYKSISTFKTIGSAGTDRDAFLVAIGTNDSRAYVSRYDRQTNTWGPLVQKGNRTWINLSGFNFSEMGPTG